jgi:hypothetical protein
MTVAIIGYTLAGVLAAGIIFIGARFIVAPRVAAAGYGVPSDLGQPSADAYLSVKGVRHCNGAVRHRSDGRRRDPPGRLGDVGRHGHPARRRDHRAPQRRLEVDRLGSPWPHGRRHAHHFRALAHGVRRRKRAATLNFMTVAVEQSYCSLLATERPISPGGFSVGCYGRTEQLREALADSASRNRVGSDSCDPRTRHNPRS